MRASPSVSAAAPCLNSQTPPPCRGTERGAGRRPGRSRAPPSAPQRAQSGPYRPRSPPGTSGHRRRLRHRDAGHQHRHAGTTQVGAVTLAEARRGGAQATFRSQQHATGMRLQQVAARPPYRHSLCALSTVNTASPQTSCVTLSPALNSCMGFLPRSVLALLLPKRPTPNRDRAKRHCVSAGG